MEGVVATGPESVTEPPPSRTRRYLGGLVFGYARQIAVVIVGFWLTPFLLRRLGPTDYGLWLVATQIIGFLALADFGIVAVLPRETAYAVGRSKGGIGELPRLLGTTARIVLWQMPLVAAAAVLAWFLLPSDWARLELPMAIILAGFVLSFPLRILGATLQGLQDLAFCGAVSSGVWLLTTVATVALVLRGYGIEALAASWVAGQVIPAGVHFMRLRRRFPGALPDHLPATTWADARGQVANGLWVSLSLVGQALLSGTDMILVGKICGPAAVFPLACTAKLVNFLANQPTALLHSAGAGLSELKVAAPDRMLTVCTALGQSVLLASGAVACVVLPVNGAFVKWWIGADAWGGRLLTMALIAEMMLRHWNTTNIFALICFGRERRLTLTFLGEGLVTVGASCALIALLGRLGAPLGELAGLLLVSLPLNLAALAVENGVSTPRLLRGLLPWSWRFGLAFAGAAASAWFFEPCGAVEIVAVAASAGLVYGAIMLPLIAQPPLDGYVRHHLPRLWRLVGPRELPVAAVRAIAAPEERPTA